MTNDDAKQLEDEAEPLDRLEKRLKLLQRYGVRAYRDGRLSLDLSGPTTTTPTKKKSESDGEALVRGV